MRFFRPKVNCNFSFSSWDSFGRRPTVTSLFKIVTKFCEFFRNSPDVSWLFPKKSQFCDFPKKWRSFVTFSEVSKIFESREFRVTWISSHVNFESREFRVTWIFPKKSHDHVAKSPFLNPCLLSPNLSYISFILNI